MFPFEPLDCGFFLRFFLTHLCRHTLGSSIGYPLFSAPLKAKTTTIEICYNYHCCLLQNGPKNSPKQTSEARCVRLAEPPHMLQFSSKPIHSFSSSFLRVISGLREKKKRQRRARKVSLRCVLFNFIIQTSVWRPLVRERHIDRFIKPCGLWWQGYMHLNRSRCPH